VVSLADRDGEPGSLGARLHASTSSRRRTAKPSAVAGFVAALDLRPGHYVPSVLEVLRYGLCHHRLLS
jgi:hypothetical protein